MRAAFAATTLLLSASAIAQCNVNPPAFVVSCPCPGQEPSIDFTGTARIGTLQRFNMASTLCNPLYGYLLVGLPSAVPIPLPDGLVACSGTLAPVSRLLVDPVYVVFTNPMPVDGSGCRSQFEPYFLFVPNQVAFVGLTVYTQFFERFYGNSSTPYFPFAASTVIGFTVQP
jgi:hypothetical protein